MRWKVGEAKQKFSEVLRSATEEPQLIFNRDRLVAAVVNEESWQAFHSWRQRQRQISLADAFADLRRIAAEEGYELEFPERRDRPNAFADIMG